MPGAYLKGNSSFPGQVFTVDVISRPWNVEGEYAAPIVNASDFTTDSIVTLRYYKLRNIISLYVTANLKPNTAPYTGSENSTAYIFTGDLTFPNKIVTEARVRLNSGLSAAGFHFENSVNVIDLRTGVFFELSRDERMGSAHINGILDATELILHVPTGLLPNHEYTIAGSLLYQAL